MSKVYTLYKEKYISKVELNTLVTKCGGSLNSIEDFVIENDDATVWIYYLNEINEDFFQEELQTLRERFNLAPMLIIQIEPSSLGHEVSGKMSLDFCKYFLKEYSDAVVEDSEGNLYTNQTIFELECDKEGNW